MNAVVNCSSFQLGLLFGVIFVNALEKMEGEGGRSAEYKIAKWVKRSETVQYTLHIFGLILMNGGFWLIIPTASKPTSSLTRFFLFFAPPIFLSGLGLFITPSLLSGTSRLTTLINSLLGIYLLLFRW